MSKIYDCNRKQVFQIGIFGILLYALLSLLLIVIIDTASKISSFIFPLSLCISMIIRTFHQLSYKIQSDDNGLSFTYSKEWETIKWDNIQRIKYRKGLFHNERIIIHIQLKDNVYIGVRTKDYVDLWVEIYEQLCKHNPSAILDPAYVQRVQNLTV